MSIKPTPQDPCSVRHSVSAKGSFHAPDIDTADLMKQDLVKEVKVKHVVTLSHTHAGPPLPLYELIMTLRPNESKTGAKGSC